MYFLIYSHTNQYFFVEIKGAKFTYFTVFEIVVIQVDMQATGNKEREKFNI